jgi:hypothetical protein
MNNRRGRINLLEVFDMATNCFGEINKHDYLEILLAR